MSLWGGLRGLALLGLALAAPALAHHSFAMFDNTRSVTLHGTVAKYQWTNPHGYLEIDAEQPGGGTRHFTLEMTSINMMTRAGWSSRTVNAGDEVTAIGHRSRDPNEKRMKAVRLIVGGRNYDVYPDMAPPA